MIAVPALIDRLPNTAQPAAAARWNEMKRCWKSYRETFINQEHQCQPVPIPVLDDRTPAQLLLSYPEELENDHLFIAIRTLCTEHNVVIETVKGMESPRFCWLHSQLVAEEDLSIPGNKSLLINIREQDEIEGLVLSHCSLNDAGVVEADFKHVVKQLWIKYIVGKAEIDRSKTLRKPFNFIPPELPRAPEPAVAQQDDILLVRELRDAVRILKIAQEDPSNLVKRSWDLALGTVNDEREIVRVAKDLMRAVVHSNIFAGSATAEKIAKFLESPVAIPKVQQLLGAVSMKFLAALCDSVVNRLLTPVRFSTMTDKQIPIPQATTEELQRTFAGLETLIEIEPINEQYSLLDQIAKLLAESALKSSGFAKAPLLNLKACKEFFAQHPGASRFLPQEILMCHIDEYMRMLSRTCGALRIRIADLKLAAIRIRAEVIYEEPIPEEFGEVQPLEGSVLLKTNEDFGTQPGSYFHAEDQPQATIDATLSEVPTQNPAPVSAPAPASAPVPTPVPAPAPVQTLAEWINANFATTALQSEVSSFFEEQGVSTIDDLSLLEEADISASSLKPITKKKLIAARNTVTSK